MSLPLKYASRTWGIYIVLMLICILFLSGITNAIVLTLVSVALLAGFGLLVFNEAAYNGEKACTTDAIVEKQIREGRQPDERLKKAGFSKKTGLAMYAICLVPFLIVSLVNLAVAPNYPSLAELEAQTQEREAFYQPEEDEVEEIAAQPTNWARVTARAVYMPYMFSYALADTNENALNWLFLLYAFVMPTVAFVGYMLGPKMRQKKLHDIALGKKRKQRNLKVNKKPRTPKAEV